MRESVERVWGWEEARQDDYVREHFGPSRRQIVQIDGQNVGVIEAEQRTNEVFLSDIQIAPAHQGQGLGTVLVRDLQRRAFTDGSVMTLQVNRANRARRLYERLGFVVTGDSHALLTALAVLNVSAGSRYHYLYVCCAGVTGTPHPRPPPQGGRGY